MIKVYSCKGINIFFFNFEHLLYMGTISFTQFIWCRIKMYFTIYYFT